MIVGRLFGESMRPTFGIILLPLCPIKTNLIGNATAVSLVRVAREI